MDFYLVLKMRIDKLVLHSCKPFIIEAYIDVAFVLHHELKSQRGIFDFWKGELSYLKHQENKICVAKSSIESEFVALTDNICFIENFQEFVSFLLNEKSETPIIYQDNTLVKSFITQGGGMTRTKHLRKECV